MTTVAAELTSPLARRIPAESFTRIFYACGSRPVLAAAVWCFAVELLCSDYRHNEFAVRLHRSIFFRAQCIFEDARFIAAFLRVKHQH